MVKTQLMQLTPIVQQVSELFRFEEWFKTLGKIFCTEWMNFVNCSSVQTSYAPTKFLGHGEICKNVSYVHCYMSYINLVFILTWTHLLISRAQAESYWPHAFIAVTAIMLTMLTLKFLALQSITQTLTKKVKILEESRLLYCQFCSWLLWVMEHVINLCVTFCVCRMSQEYFSGPSWLFMSYECDCLSCLARSASLSLVPDKWYYARKIISHLLHEQ